MMPYSMEDERRKCPGIKYMLEIEDGTGTCAIVGLRDLSQRLSDSS